MNAADLLASGGAAAAFDASDFLITEVPGQQATAEQLAMFLTRYRFLREYCRGKDVLEIACGGGQGLGYLAREARRVVGGDRDWRIVPAVARRYRDRPTIALRAFDAQSLPFLDRSFDVVALLDSIYWLDDQAACVREVRRVLRPGGVFVVTTVNHDWPEFCPSPFGTRYLNGSELVDFLDRHGFQSELFAAFESAPRTGLERAIAIVRRGAIASGLMPTRIRAKERLKRVFFGPLATIPDEVVDDMAPYHRPVPVSSSEVGGRYKLLYVVSRLP